MMSLILLFLEFTLAGAQNQNDNRRIPMRFSQQSSSQNQGSAGGRYASVRATNSINRCLLGSLAIGSPPRNYDMLFDTGSTLFWVMDSRNCSGKIKGRAGNCPGKNHFNPSRSQSFVPADGNQKTIHYHYGPKEKPGAVLDCTVIGHDDLYLGKNKIISKQPICAANNVVETGMYDNGFEFDGVLGLGPDAKSSASNVGNTLLANVDTISFWYNQQLLLNRVHGQKQDKNQNIGEIIIGDHSEFQNKLYGRKEARLSIGSEKHWKVKLDSIQVGSGPAINVGASVLFDTGIPSAFLPTSTWNQQYAKYQPFIVKAEAAYFINCNHVHKLQTISFKFGDQTISMNGRDQVIVKSNCKCMLIFAPQAKTGYSDFIPMGAPFLSNFFTVYDYNNKDINFYQSIQAKDNRNCSM
jgi:hypothetical protein